MSTLLKNNEINNRTKWNSFVLENNGSFLQSFEWGETQESMGRKCWKLEITDSDSKEITLEALVIKHDLPFGKNYLYVPFGPVVRNPASELAGRQESGIRNQEYNKIFHQFLKEVGVFADKEKSVFLKIDFSFLEVRPPNIENTIIPRSGSIWGGRTSENFENFGFVKSNKEVQPSKTIILDLTKSEDDILKNMKPKKRYGIRLAEKRGVVIREGNSKEDFESLWKLLEETAKRSGFSIHPKEYYEKLLSGKNNFESLESCNKLFLAEYEGEVLAGAIINFFGKQVTYLHGASSDKHRGLMAPYLLHWEIIKKAKQFGFEKYDLWGISDKYPGVTKFKEGFGGEKVNRGGVYDLIYNKFWYWVYNAARKINRR